MEDATELKENSFACYNKRPYATALCNQTRWI